MGFSLGGAVTRKAILGGKCIDNNNDLGPPLTSIVSKYFSMSGVNWGVDFCVDRYRTQPICNNVSGVYPYSSKFIKDINKEQHYEGKSTYIIASKNDEVVGYNEMYLPKADVNVTFNCVGSPTNMNGFFPFHVAAMLQTLNSQFELIKTGRVSQQTLDADVQSENLNFGQQCTGTVQYGSQDENNSRSYNVFSCSFFVVAAFLILRFVLY
ncbi:Lipase domain containing protein [Aphelenchoides bicaudatus]|nr:Lipase domain containing protein [Aphelenchoides bicaudatus]